MKNNEHKYVIYQGVMSASGCGDYYAMAYASTLKEARKLFNRLKKDTKGWIKQGNNSYLETSLERKNYDDGSRYNIDYFTIKL